MFGKHLFNEAEYVKYVQNDRVHRSILMWKGVINVPPENIEMFLEHVYETQLPKNARQMMNPRSQLRASGNLIF